MPHELIDWPLMNHPGRVRSPTSAPLLLCASMLLTGVTDRALTRPKRDGSHP